MVSPVNNTSAVVITQVEAIRAAVMSVVTSGASLLVLLHIWDMSAEQLAGLTAFLSQVIILIFLFWKPRSSIISPQTIQLGDKQGNQ